MKEKIRGQYRKLFIYKIVYCTPKKIVEKIPPSNTDIAAGDESVV